MSDLDNLLSEFSKFDRKKKKVKVDTNEYCEMCDAYSLCNDKGIEYCNICGVINNVVIDQSAEWRFYGADDNKNSNPARCGYHINKLLPQSSLGTMISRKRGESYEMKKLRKYHTWNSMPYRERSLYNVFNTISIRSKNAGLSDCIIEEAKVLYKLVSENKISRGPNRKGLIAACIYIACKIKNVPRSSKEIASIFSITPTNLTKGCKRFMEIVNTNNIINNKNINLASSTSTDFIHRFCSKLSLNKDIVDICLHVAKKAEEYYLVSENTPPSIAAGSIYLVSSVLNLNLNKKTVSKHCKISEVTICKCYKKLKQYQEYIFPEI
tara:strand:+ start:4553 stop:5524 length:972 start_codon:yes stop_codon:yes gene_type:complete